jgi:hypothetical protein
MTLHIDDKAIAQLRHHIEAIRAVPCTTPAQVIATLLPELDAARARGVPFKELLPLLNGAGITLSAKTLRDYMSRARRAPAQNAGGALPSAPPCERDDTSSPSIDAMSTPTSRLQRQKHSATPTFPSDRRKR